MKYPKVPFNENLKYSHYGNGVVYSISEQRMVYFPLNDINSMSDSALRKAISLGFNEVLESIDIERFSKLYDRIKLDPYMIYPGRLFDPSNPKHVNYAYIFSGLNQEQQKAVYRSNYDLSFDGGMNSLRNSYFENNDLNVFLGDDYSVFADMPPISSEYFVHKIEELRGKDVFWKIAQYIEPKLRQRLLTSMK